MKMSKAMHCVQGNNEDINKNPKILSPSAVCLLFTIQGSIDKLLNSKQPKATVVRKKERKKSITIVLQAT